MMMVQVIVACYVYVKCGMPVVELHAEYELFQHDLGICNFHKRNGGILSA